MNSFLEVASFVFGIAVNTFIVPRKLIDWYLKLDMDVFSVKYEF
jgi:hypothetical protein